MLFDDFKLDEIDSVIFSSSVKRLITNNVVFNSLSKNTY